MQKPLSRLRIEDLTTSNDVMARCLQLAALAAKTDVPVVLLGETGTGKTLLAHAIHNSRSEEHTSELQSRFDLVCRLLLEKKKKKKITKKKKKTKIKKRKGSNDKSSI